jgi:hypothetical protein
MPARMISPLFAALIDECLLRLISRRHFDVGLIFAC